MDEYEVGKVYTRSSDGKSYRYTGAKPDNPRDLSNWELVSGSGEQPKTFGNIRAFLRNAADMATFGGADEIAGIGAALVPGGRTGAEARTASRENLATMRENNKGASLAGSLVGVLPSMVMPVAGVAGATARIPMLAKAVQSVPMLAKSRGLLGAAKGTSSLAGLAARGGGVGALEGGLFGLGSAEGSLAERMPATAFGAATGGFGGAITGPVMGLLSRRASGRSQRVADDLRRQSGLPGDRSAALGRADDMKATVKAEGYKRLEDAFPVIDDPDVLRLLRSENIIKHTGAISDDVAKGVKSPSFKEAQLVLRRLERIGKRDYLEEINALNTALDKAVAGYSDVDAAFRVAIRAGTAVEKGEQSYGMSAAQISDALKKMTSGMQPDDARIVRDQFRQGQLATHLRRLEARDEEAPALLKRWMDSGTESRAVMRTMFEPGPAGDVAFEQFLGTLKREKSAAKINATLRMLAKPTAIAAVVGGAIMAKPVSLAEPP